MENRVDFDQRRSNQINGFAFNSNNLTFGRIWLISIKAQVPNKQIFRPNGGGDSVPVRDPDRACPRGGDGNGARQELELELELELILILILTLILTVHGA